MRAAVPESRHQCIRTYGRVRCLVKNDDFTDDKWQLRGSAAAIGRWLAEQECHQKRTAITQLLTTEVGNTLP